MSKIDAKKALVAFFSELEDSSERHHELMDSDVREALHLTLNYYFIWGNDDSILPKLYGMFSAQGDRHIADTVRKFLADSAIKAMQATSPVGMPRLQFLQDRTIRTRAGRQYDEFIGHVDDPLPNKSLPEYMFEEGEYEYD